MTIPQLAEKLNVTRQTITDDMFEVKKLAKKFKKKVLKTHNYYRVVECNGN
jgi:transcriptional antiterminator